MTLPRRDVLAQDAHVVAVPALMRHAVIQLQHRAVDAMATCGCRTIRFDIVVGHEVIDHRRAAREHHHSRGLELRIGGLGAFQLRRDLLHR